MLTKEDKQEIRKIVQQELKEFFESQDEKLTEKLNTPIEALELSIRASNCLKQKRIHTIGDLVSTPIVNLLTIRSFGETSLREVRRRLANIGLSLEMFA